MTITNVGWEDPRTDYGDFVNGQYATDSPSVNASLFNTLCSILANTIGKFAPRAQDTPDLTIYVSAGVAYFGDTLVSYAGGNSGAMVAPAANPRIDRVYLTRAGALAITTGSEAASPSAPAIVTDTFPICLIYHRVGSVHIDDADDGSNSYIYRDDRPIFQAVDEPLNDDLTPSSIYVASGYSRTIFVQRGRTFTIPQDVTIAGDLTIQHGM